MTPVAAQASETTTYAYDALGRLTGASNAGVPSVGVATAIQFDPAGNRTNYQVTGSSNLPPPSGFVIVPLNGFTLIPLYNF